MPYIEPSSDLHPWLDTHLFELGSHLYYMWYNVLRGGDYIGEGKMLWTLLLCNILTIIVFEDPMRNTVG